MLKVHKTITGQVVREKFPSFVNMCAALLEMFHPF